jgi:hypothetical protein
MLREVGRPDAQRDAHREGDQNLPEQRARKALHGESSFGFQVSWAPVSSIAIVGKTLSRSLHRTKLLRWIVGAFTAS